MDNEDIASYNPMSEWPEAISGAYYVFSLLMKSYCSFGGPRAGQLGGETPSTGILIPVSEQMDSKQNHLVKARFLTWYLQMSKGADEYSFSNHSLAIYVGSPIRELTLKIKTGLTH